MMSLCGTEQLHDSDDVQGCPGTNFTNRYKESDFICTFTQTKYFLQNTFYYSLGFNKYPVHTKALWTQLARPADRKVPKFCTNSAV